MGKAIAAVPSQFHWEGHSCNSIQLQFGKPLLWCYRICDGEVHSDGVIAKQFGKPLLWEYRTCDRKSTAVIFSQSNAEGLLRSYRACQGEARKCSTSVRSMQEATAVVFQISIREATKGLTVYCSLPCGIFEPFKATKSFKAS
jgi:hypothetical protein